MSKQKRYLKKADAMFRKPDNRSTQEKLADSKAKREAAQAIGRKDKPRKK